MLNLNALPKIMHVEINLTLYLICVNNPVPITKEKGNSPDL